MRRAGVSRRHAGRRVRRRAGLGGGTRVVAAALDGPPGRARAGRRVRRVAGRPLGRRPGAPAEGDFVARAGRAGAARRGRRGRARPHGRAARRPRGGALPGRGRADRPGRRAHPGRGLRAHRRRTSLRTAVPARGGAGRALRGAGRGGRREVGVYCGSGVSGGPRGAGPGSRGRSRRRCTSAPGRSGPRTRPGRSPRAPTLSDPSHLTRRTADPLHGRVERGTRKGPHPTGPALRASQERADRRAVPAGVARPGTAAHSCFLRRVPNTISSQLGTAARRPGRTPSASAWRSVVAGQAIPVTATERGMSTSAYAEPARGGGRRRAPRPPTLLRRAPRSGGLGAGRALGDDHVAAEARHRLQQAGQRVALALAGLLLVRLAARRGRRAAVEGRSSVRSSGRSRGSRAIRGTNGKLGSWAVTVSSDLADQRARLVVDGLHEPPRRVVRPARRVRLARDPVDQQDLPGAVVAAPRVPLHGVLLGAAQQQPLLHGLAELAGRRSRRAAGRGSSGRARP